MPIDYKKYPSNWLSEIRPEALKRADNCCQLCGIRNHSVGYRNKKGEFVRICGSIYLDWAGYGFVYPNHEPISYKEARGIVEANNVGDEKFIVIVITIAHLDHDIENNDSSNLKAMCQKCHLNYDKEHHKQTRLAKKKQLTLF